MGDIWKFELFFSLVGVWSGYRMLLSICFNTRDSLDRHSILEVLHTRRM